MAYSDLSVPQQARIKADLALEVCGEEFVAQTAPYFSCQLINGPRQVDTNKASVWISGDNVVSLWDCNPHSRSRTDKHLGAVGHVLNVCRFISGSERGIDGNGPVHRVPGPIYVTDLGRHFDGLVTARENERIVYQELEIPKKDLDLPQDCHAQERMIPAQKGASALLHACMNDIFLCLDCETEEALAVLLDRFCALLKVNLGVHPQRGDVRAQLRDALFEQILAFIEQNLGDLDMNTELILQNFGVSRASLYRMFETVGGVRNYIMQRRITRATLDIEKNAEIRGSLRQAAMDWGFSSQANFNRAIRRQFGNSPSALFSSPSGRTTISTPFKSAYVLGAFKRSALAA
ncbi:MAG: helix-turn-helix domain-containing protein [Henriciella sp.]|nr:helix-turn-helix domain-containing protein [Henriciella sp.]